MERARKVDALSREVAEASDQQNKGIEQVNAAVTSVEYVTQGNTALQEQTHTLEALVTRLKTLVGVRAAAERSACPQPTE